MKKKNLLMTAIAVFGIATTPLAQVPNYVPTNGLIGWWPFNGNANDESLNMNNGINNGATLTTDRFNNINSALSFNGTSNYINVPNNNTLNPNSITISTWINSNANATDAESGGKAIVTKWYQNINCNNLGDNYNLALSFLNNQSVLVGSTIANNQISNSISSQTNLIGLNTWRHIVFIHDSINGQKLYIDGIQVNSLIITGGLCNTLNDLLFGADNSIGNIWRYFDGKLDDIGIWNRALTQQEITNLYNSTNCSNNLSISPASNQLQSGSTANFVATTSDTFPSFVWQSDFGQGFQTLNNYGNYSGVNTNSLSLSNVQLPNHTQPIRVISTSGECIDTSNVATINITDTCIVTINDTITTLISVTDTLIINTLITGLTPPNNLNTIKVFPNPTNNHLTIDFGNFASMNGYTLKITNSIGQTVFTTPINQQSSYVDLSTWGGNGIYFVQIIDTQNNTIENRKIVLQ
jgi:hypothetical protein